jgi:UDP-N-acetylglucosamine--dolichyl-phosphate N-acetylglucosaminephosphotransferase
MYEVIFIAMFISFILTFFSMPPAIEKLQDGGFVVVDMYKAHKPQVPTKGGIVVLFVAFLTLVTVGIWLRILSRMDSGMDLPKDLSETDTAILLVVAMYALYGMTDDLINVGRPAKVILPLMFAYPLLIVVTPSNYTLPLWGAVDFTTGVEIPFMGTFTLAAFTKVVIMPIYIMVVANLMNMHSGFNGLQSGLSTIILIFLIIKALKEGVEDKTLVVSAFAGAMIAFYWFNRHPSKVFEGNIGALAIGSAIGCTIIVTGFVISGMVMLFPHILNFLMYVRWRIMNKLRPEDEKWAISKFGGVRKDNCLDVPNPHTLKWVLPYYFNVNEKQAAYGMFALTTLFCTIGLFLPS